MFFNKYRKLEGMAKVQKQINKEDLQEEYHDLCRKIKSYPEALAEMEKEFNKLRRRQLAMSEQLSKL